MPRAHRHFLPGFIWHITYRCHDRDFLLKFKWTCDLWRSWLYEARKRYGIRVLNYTITSNHIHLLVAGSQQEGCNEIASSMQLISGQTALAYNRHKNRLGAFWEDRYHATAVQDGEHFWKCMVYIDMNMVSNNRGTVHLFHEKNQLADKKRELWINRCTVPRLLKELNL